MSPCRSRTGRPGKRRRRRMKFQSRIKISNNGNAPALARSTCLFLNLLGCFDQILCRVTIPVTLPGQLGADHALTVQNYRRGVRNACRLALRLLVEKAVSGDGLAAGVGKQREGDLVLVREFGKDLDGIITDADDGEASGFQVLEVRLQLHELLLAERS